MALTESILHPGSYTSDATLYARLCAAAPDRNPMQNPATEMGLVDLYTFYEEAITFAPSVRGRVLLRGEIVRLHPRVFDLVAFLGETPGRAYGNSTIIETLWPEERPHDPEGALRIGIARARKALGEAAIINYRGYGYAACE